MDTKKIPYFSINRYISLSIGLWPTDATALRRFQKSIVTVILLSSFYPQIGALVKYRSSLYTCCRIFMCCAAPIACSLKYFNFAFDSKHRTRKVLEWIQLDWDTYTKKEEQDILEKHGKLGRTRVIVQLFIYTSVIAGMMFPYVPWFYNILTHQNKTNVLRTPVILEYYILDETKHIHWIMLHANTCYLVGAHAIIATETINMLIVEHACALFELVRHYISIGIEDTIVRSNRSIIRWYIKTIVRVHYRAIGFVAFLNYYFMFHYTFLLGLGLVTLSLSLYIFADSIMNTHNFDALITSGVVIVCHIGYMYMCNYQGQKIMDGSSSIFLASYCTRWYLAPLPMQKFLILFLERCLRTSCFVTGGIIKASFELLSTELSMSLSYFTVLWSLI